MSIHSIPPVLALPPFERVWLSAVCCFRCFGFFVLFLVRGRSGLGSLINAFETFLAIQSNVRRNPRGNFVVNLLGAHSKTFLCIFLFLRFGGKYAVSSSNPCCWCGSGTSVLLVTFFRQWKLVSKGSIPEDAFPRVPSSSRTRRGARLLLHQ